MSGGYLGPVRLVAVREAREMVRSRYYQGSLVIQLLIVVGIVLAAALTGDDGAESFAVGVSGERSAAAAVVERAGRLGSADDVEVEARELSGRDAIEAAITDGEVEAGLLDGELLAEPGADEQLIGLLRTAASREASAEILERGGLDQRRIEAALDPPQLPLTELDSDEEASGTVAFLGGLLLYIALLLTGYSVAGGIVGEKSSRVIELILAAIRPMQALIGKLVAIGLLGLAQVVLIAGAGLGLALALGEVELPASTPETVLLVLLFFVLGYALYGCAFAAAGSIVSRQEDVQSTTAPLLIVLVGGYILSFSVVEDPDGTIARIASFLPPLAPMVVPARAAEGALPLAELLVSVALMVVAIACIAWLAARIYERAVLRMGAPLSIVEGLRLVRRTTL